VSLPRPLHDAIESALGEAVTNASRVGGGDLNDAWRVELGDHTAVFIKTADHVKPGVYTTEAQGLRWLAEPGALEVPDVLAELDPSDPDHDGPRLLALEWIEEGTLGPGGEEELGRGLAKVHEAGAPTFGGDAALRLGPLEVPNDPTDSWPEFYAERRLRPLARDAESKGALPSGCMRAIDRVCERLHDLAGPEEMPARLHGDLWSGNVLAASDGRPYLIDPAAYGGHREVDLAMLRLFGGPSQRCFAAYEEITPLAEGHEERVELWQLFPLLVHAVLFGGAYGSSVARIAERLG
jgi:fructosamine-3-kinase